VSSDDSARLLERLLEDPAFRARFSRNPAAAAREAGFEALAEDLENGERPFQTLEMRESRSSVAGVMLAAAVEGLGLFELSEHVLPHLGAEDALAADQPPQPDPAGKSPPPVGPDDLADVDPDDPVEPDVDDGGESDDSAASDDYGDPGESDDSDDSPDSGDSDVAGDSANPDGSADSGDDSDDEDDEDDDDEPDEEEPDEEEPDEEGPDADDLSDDENVGGGSDDGGEDSDDSADGNDSDDSGASDDSDDSGASDDSDDSGASDDSDDSGASDDSDDSGDSGDSGDHDDSDEDIDLGPVPDRYPGDDASQKQIGAWMGHEAQKRGLPPELPVMAALVDSGMQNLPSGDADSVGLFQMRLSIWNTGDYAGYPARPEKQLDWFLDRAKAVKAQRTARGLPTDPDHYGEWIADVERPAAQHRGRYQLRLEDAQDLLRRAFPDGDGLEDAADAGGGSGPHAGPRAREAVAAARKYLGTPYQWGGESPKTGFDCSGLVQWAYAKAGIQIPRVTDQQILAPRAVKVGRKHLLPGDLVFFRDASGYVHHVGMSLGGDRFIEAPRTGLKVRISSLNDPYYAQQFTGARRFDPPAPGSSDARVMRALRLSDDG
jgi:hypothetical protein